MIRDTEIKAMTIAAIVIAIAFASCGIAYAMNADKRAQRRESTYQAWVKLTGRNDITRDEWETLSRSKLLRQTK